MNSHRTSASGSRIIFWLCRGGASVSNTRQASAITGGIPRGLFDFLVGTARWSFRINAYANLLRDDYPPFSMK